jgi:hypothetical protein
MSGSCHLSRPMTRQTANTCTACKRATSPQQSLFLARVTSDCYIRIRALPLHGSNRLGQPRARTRESIARVDTPCRSRGTTCTPRLAGPRAHYYCSYLAGQCDFTTLQMCTSFSADKTLQLARTARIQQQLSRRFQSLARKFECCSSVG